MWLYLVYKTLSLGSSVSLPIKLNINSLFFCVFMLSEFVEFVGHKLLRELVWILDGMLLMMG